VAGQWQPSGPQRPPDHLVDRVVPADVLAQAHQLTRRGEQSRGVQPAGHREAALCRAQRVGQRDERARGDPGRVAGHVKHRPGADRVDARLAADATGGGGEEVARRIGGRRWHVWCQRDVNHVVRVRRLVPGAELGGPDVVRIADDAFGEEEPQRQVEVVTGGTHGDREGRPLAGARRADADLQGLFGGEAVGALDTVDSPVSRVDVYHGPPLGHPSHSSSVRVASALMGGVGFAAVVLAGGAGRRLGGRGKPLLPVGGRPMLERVLDAVATAEPRVVVGPLELALPPGVLRTREEPPGGGPVAALAAGLALVPEPAGQVAVLAADLPFLTAADLRALWPVPGADGCVFVDEGGRDQWLCGMWWTAALRSRLAAVGDVAGRSLREVLSPLRVVRITAASHPAPWYDCDTEDQLRAAQAAAAVKASAVKASAVKASAVKRPEPGDDKEWSG